MRSLNVSRVRWSVIGAILLSVSLLCSHCLAGISIGEINGPFSCDSGWPPQGEGGPCWSPDGTKIAFSWGDGYTAWDASFGRPNPDGQYICIMTADGNEIRGPGNPLVNDVGWDNHSPDWGPDHGPYPNWIVYSGTRVGPAYIARVNPDDGTVVKIPGMIGGHPKRPKWSPDGTKIAYLGGDWKGSPNPHHICLTDPDGSFHENLTQNMTVYEEGIHGLSWSLDGSQIVFTQYGLSGLFVLDVATKGVTTLPGFPSGLTPYAPVWAEENSILFAAGGGIYDYQIDTQTTTQLTYGPNYPGYGGPASDHLGDWHSTEGLVFSSSRNCTVRWDSNIYTAISALDFAISDVKPVQVVFDSELNNDDKIDLVAGKDTAVLVYVGMEGYERLDKEELVSVRLDFGGVDFTESETIAELEENPRIEFYPASPTTTGDLIIIAEVDPENEFEEADETNNEKSVQITVKETNSLYLVYFPVDGIDPDGPFGPSPGEPGLGYGPIDMSDYRDTVKNSGIFIGAVYPVAEGNFTNEKQEGKYYGRYPLLQLGMVEDIINIWLWAELLTDTLADKAIGIVPSNYFSYHGEGDASGVTFPATSGGALVEVNNWTTAAHEIGHTYGLRLPWPWGPGEEYKTNDPGNEANGFWIPKKLPPEDYEGEISNGICFMGYSLYPPSFDFWWPGHPEEQPMWICDEDYIDLFQKFRVDKTDPPAVLLLNGIISKDGTIQLGSLYMVENGIADNIMPGDYSIQILDMDGQILTNIPFHTGFYAYLDPIGIVETDFAGFAFVVPYPENTSRIEIQHEGEVLIEITPNSKLLHDAVDSIPDYGFINNPDQCRKALHNKIDEAEEKIENNEIRDARNKLEFDIRDKFKKWLVDGYGIEDPLQLSKEEVIELVNRMMERLAIQ